LYAQVIVDIAHQDIDHLFTYKVPQELLPLSKAGMRVKVPFGGRKQVEGFIIALTDTCEIAPSLLKPIISFVDAQPVITQEQLALISWMQKEYHAKAIDIIRLLVPSDLRSGRVREKFNTIISLAISQEQAEQMLESEIKYASKAYSIISLLLEVLEVEKSYINQTLGNADAALKTLESKGIIKSTKLEQKRSPYMGIAPTAVNWHSLNIEQHAVLQELKNAIDSNGNEFLLHGVTGSGKTEVYMRAIDYAAQSGKSAIVLVPEISLTPQMVNSFRERLGNNIAVLHSALSIGERYDEWRRIRSGEAKIVIGARSAIFAPCTDIGLIVVDEEHEGSYISDTHPRYDAVEVAAFRAKYNNAVLLLGSATPSIARYYKAKQGKYKILELNGRINGQPLPKVELVNMADEFSSGNRSIFSKRLFTLLDETIKDKNQAMLFLNRRGYSSFVMCRACGETISCKNCDVSLTYHSGVKLLRCHYCNFEMPLPNECPSCGSKYIKQFGAGTQKVEEEFSKFFPDTNVLRMDVDTTKTKDAHYHILKKFADQEAQVLVGTQMIAKGHDFPMVALVGVIAAETMLRLPDYRSRERTFSLITQVAGRAGRAQTKGSVIVQTYTPQHFAITAAAQHDYSGFYNHEIAERQAMWYPPFAVFIRILFSSENAENSLSFAQSTFGLIKDRLSESVIWKENILYFQVTPSPIGRLKGLSRHQILIKLKETDSTKELTNSIFELAEGVQLKDTYRSIEVNPTNLF